MLRFAAERLQEATEKVTGMAQFSMSASEGHEENAEPAFPLVIAARGVIVALCVPDPALPAVMTLPPFVAETSKLFVVRPVEET